MMWISLWLAVSVVTLFRVLARGPKHGNGTIAGVPKHGHMFSEPDFRLRNEGSSIVIYRLIGNDMPPLQTVGQLRWNTLYTLANERNFPGVRKRWILNRIWNETEFELLYSELLRGGVHRRDILTRCFDLDEYNEKSTVEEKLLYLTSQNEGRNAGIMDGRQSGFEWIFILDGNTFISDDSWAALREATEKATIDKKHYFKIPYHRLHALQDPSWLNRSTPLEAMIAAAPLKGESQIAFHRNATQIFSLGDTKPENRDPSRKKGYGLRNKSYMFRPGAICGPDSNVCHCANVAEGKEEDFAALSYEGKLKYARECGLVLRLWSYPTADVVQTGLNPAMEEGFFCYFASIKTLLLSEGAECNKVRKAVSVWADLEPETRQLYRADSARCKAEYSSLVLQDSCFRTIDRDVAQKNAMAEIERMLAVREERRAHAEPGAITLCKSLRHRPP